MLIAAMLRPEPSRRPGDGAGSVPDMTAHSAGAPGATEHRHATSSTRIGFLGPAGTFSEQVIERLDDLADAQRVPYTLMTDVLFGVAEGELDLGVVPVENAIEGTVNAIVDTLAFDVDSELRVCVPHGSLRPRQRRGSARLRGHSPVASRSSYFSVLMM